jgi:hypothetical protein
MKILLKIIFIFQLAHITCFAAEKQDVLVEQQGKFETTVHYIIFAKDIPIGTAQFSTNFNKNKSPITSPFDFSFEGKFIQQLGESVVNVNVSTSGKWELKKIKGSYEIQLKSVGEVFSKEQTHWPESSGRSLQILQNLLPISLETKELRLPFFSKEKKDKYRSENYNIDFLPKEKQEKQSNSWPIFIDDKNLNESKPTSFNPFTAMVYKKDGIKNEDFLTYGSDEILEKGDISWFNDVLLKFQRVPYEKIKNIQENILNQSIDLGLFSHERAFSNDLNNLLEKASSCTDFSEGAEKIVKKRAPQLPYLVHRKIFNLKTMCKRIENLIERNSAKNDSEKILDSLGLIVKTTLSEERKELPFELQNSLVEFVFTDPKLRWQWIRFITKVIQKTQIDLDAILNIEIERKSTLLLRVQVEKLPPQSVVKGILKAKSPGIESSIVESTNPEMRPSSITSLDTVTKEFEFLNGLSYARQLLSQEKDFLNQLCQKFGGTIGIDLGEMNNSLLNSYIAIGKWNEDSKIRTLREFAKQASANLACKKIKFLVPKSLKDKSIQELASFHKDILQTQSQFQLTNLQNRTLRIIPGEYELELFSLISGASIGKKRFMIPDNHETSHLKLKF